MFAKNVNNYTAMFCIWCFALQRRDVSGESANPQAHPLAAFQLCNRNLIANILLRNINTRSAAERTPSGVFYFLL